MLAASHKLFTFEQHSAVAARRRHDSRRDAGATAAALCRSFLFARLSFRWEIYILRKERWRLGTDFSLASVVPSWGSAIAPTALSVLKA